VNTKEIRHSYCVNSERARLTANRRRRFREAFIRVEKKGTPIDFDPDLYMYSVTVFSCGVPTSEKVIEACERVRSVLCCRWNQGPLDRIPVLLGVVATFVFVLVILVVVILVVVFVVC
jgi:hypothetical protein